jgi:MFS family permease
LNKLKLDKKKRILMVTILIIALVQMPSLALTPAINVIQTKAFPDRSLSQVQSAIALTSLVSPLTSILAAFLINRGKATKKGVVVFGLCCLSMTGLLALLFHSDYWQLFMYSIVLGTSTGFFMTNNFGLLFDNFEDRERQVITGYQTSCINVGGILISLTGGVLATMMWYGGYLIFLIGLPIAVLAFFTVPNYKSPAASGLAGGEAKKKLNPRIFYYSVLACIFMAIYGVCSNNISTHIANLGDSAMSGIAVAVQMGGGVVSGFFFGRLSEKFGDMVMVIACAFVFVGYMLLTLFVASLAMIFVAVFITGLSLSLMLPRCIYSVSTLVDANTSATATVIVSSVAPSLGGFLSPLVFTNLTEALFGESTVKRFLFVGLVALAYGVVIALITLTRAKALKRNTP